MFKSVNMNNRNRNRNIIKMNRLINEAKLAAFIGFFFFTRPVAHGKALRL